MFNQLLGLYKSHRTNTPLEDFTTEAFVGILKINSEVRHEFLQNFLGFTEGEYFLKTQVHYPLVEDNDCLVDFVIESDDLLCFIENKVNSVEGERQLERYSKVLNLQKKRTTKLIYCTKYYEKKLIDIHDFQQIRWFEIAHFLRKFSNNDIVKSFIEFLKRHDMAQELTLTSKDLLTLENLQNTLSIAYEYIERAEPLFKESFRGDFKYKKYSSDSFKYNRLVNAIENVLGEGANSEIKYGFQLNSLVVYVALYISNRHGSYVDLNQFSKNCQDPFEVNRGEWGTSIEIKIPIANYLNDTEAESKINDFFKNSFVSFSDLISSYKTLISNKLK
jgi:hypothetical protein